MLSEKNGSENDAIFIQLQNNFTDHQLQFRWQFVKNWQQDNCARHSRAVLPRLPAINRTKQCNK